MYIILFLLTFSQRSCIPPGSYYLRHPSYPPFFHICAKTRPSPVPISNHMPSARSLSPMFFPGISGCPASPVLPAISPPLGLIKHLRVSRLISSNHHQGACSEVPRLNFPGLFQKIYGRPRRSHEAASCLCNLQFLSSTLLISGPSYHSHALNASAPCRSAAPPSLVPRSLSSTSRPAPLCFLPI